MRRIELDATNWHSVLECYEEIKGALGCPKGHGTSLDALIDSMVYGGMNRVEAPYVIHVKGTSKCPPEIGEHLHLLANVIRQAREDQRRRYGKETEVRFEIAP